MAPLRATEWRKFPVSLTELCIDTSLRCGQSFRWRKSDGGIWSCALHGRILSLRQDSTHLHYRAIFPTPSCPLPTPPSSSPPSSPSNTPSAAGPEEDDTAELVRHYFNLETNLTSLYRQWSSADLNFETKAPKFTGVRILRQSAWEALVGFICSSNNNIARISQMVEKLCLTYGPLLGHVASQPFHDLPSPAALTNPKVEDRLRALGFGYRAKFLHQTAIMVAEERPLGWLESLRNPENPLLGHVAASAGEMEAQGRAGYRTAHEQLLELQGVGPKVADCVCLMGLGWGEAVPVDTHVWQIAQRDYRFGRGKHKSLTKATYDAVGDHFRSLWGKEAGWAHSVLFTADLRAFAERLVAKVEVKDEDKLEEAKDTDGIPAPGLTLMSVARTTIKREADEAGIEVAVVDDERTQRWKRRRRV
ncbi:MAG: 8-oxoguanine glycosylase ogg1 [Thelocarpon superellum]|nr:MAG: 8-oxoguanine glycosylase ogg1 [Thelocarpon superellum]